MSDKETIVLIEAPCNTVCCQCGLLIRVKKIGLTTFVGEHSETASCERSGEMYEIQAKAVEISRRMKVPQFVKDFFIGG